MGDFNSNSPSLRGMEWRPSSVRQFSFDATTKGLAMRVKAGGAVTVSALDHFVSNVVGSPGMGVEILDTLVPTGLALNAYKPGTDTGAVTTGWVNESGGAVGYGKVSDGSNSTYLKNSGTITYGSPLVLLYRGSAAALSGKRIANSGSTVGINLTFTLAASGTANFAKCRGVLDIGGTRYYTAYVYKSVLIGSTTFSVQFPYNPATNLPWTQAEFNNFTNATTDEFGIEVQAEAFLGGAANAAAGDIRVAEMAISCYTVTENRKGFIYSTSLGSSTAAWLEETLGSTAAMSANTWYWVHIFNWLNAAGSNYFQMPVLQAPSIIEAASASTSTGDHRKVYETTIVDSSGVISSYTATDREMIPVLLDRSGTIETQSQPYCEVDTVDIYNGSVTNFGSEITSAAGATAYGGLKVIVGWQNTSQRPDAPLTFTIRRGGGFLTGGGTLDATFTLAPTDLTSGGLQDVTVPISGFTTQVGATQYGVAVTSTATDGKGWKVAVLDTRSDVVTSGVTAAEVQGASQGGTTDSYYTGGTENDRYDMPIAFVASPAAPSGFTASPAAAA